MNRIKINHLDLYRSCLESEENFGALKFRAVAEILARVTEDGRLIMEFPKQVEKISVSADNCLTSEFSKNIHQSLTQRDAQFIELFMPVWEWFYRYYFQVKTDGWHHIPTTGKVLLVGSHNGGMASPDLIMMMYDWFSRFGTERLVYGLMHPSAWKVSPEIAGLAQKFGAIVAHPKMASAAFDRGASVLVYPGGQYDMFRPHSQRHKIHFAGHQGFIKLALKQEVPIIPVISVGAHDSLIVLCDCYDFVKQLHQWGLPWLYQIDPGVFPIYLGLPWGLSIGPLPNIPLPVQIHTRICQPITFERYGRDAARDRNYVNACYEIVQNQMQEELNNLVRDTQKSS